MIEYKICSRCRIPLPVSEFNKNRSKKDGYQHNCKSCKAIIHINTRGSVLRKQKEYRANNSESISKKKKIHYHENRDEYLAKKAIYKLENKEKIAVSDKSYKDKLKGVLMKFEMSKMFIKKLEFISIETVIFLGIAPADLEFLWENQKFNVSNCLHMKDCYFVHTNSKKKDEGFVVPNDWFTFKNPKFNKNSPITKIRPFEGYTGQSIDQEFNTEENEKQRDELLDIEMQINKKRKILSDEKLEFQILKEEIEVLKKEKKVLQQARYDLTYANKKKEKVLLASSSNAELVQEESRLDEKVASTEIITKHHKREVELLENTIDILKKCLFREGNSDQKN